MKRLLLLLFAMVVALPCLYGQAAQGDPRGNVILGNEKNPKKEKNPTSRNVRGTVTDESGRPLENALVTLTNQDTHESLTYFTKKDGTYYFDGLSFTTDYKLIGQYKNGKSIEKTLSQYDHSPRIVRILEVVQPPTTAAANK
jgi:hypothetical protein